MVGSGSRSSTSSIGSGWHGIRSLCTFGVQVIFGGFRCGCYGLRGESLAPLPVLATATPSGVVHLLEGIAIGAHIQHHFKEFLPVKTLDSLGSDDVVVLSAYPS
uniref:Uncharacterized protein n=1 Tax=Oryza barthii TaxID=65489 RepID=A0A0D3F852_9ORYZ